MTNDGVPIAVRASVAEAPKVTVKAFTSLLNAIAFQTPMEQQAKMEQGNGDGGAGSDANEGR